MKAMNFRYKEYGDSIMLKMKDWRRVTKFLADHGVTVTENFSPGALRTMSQLKQRASDGFKRSPNCTCDTQPHAPWCADSKKRRR